MSGEGVINQFSLTSRAKLQGDKVVEGVLIAPTLALGFKSKKNNGKYRYVWLLKGKFELTADEYDTE